VRATVPFAAFREGRLGSGGVEWFFGGVLVAVSGGITGFTGYLLWRLFHTEPVPNEAALDGGSRGDE
jgi:hypothetical protein